MAGDAFMPWAIYKVSELAQYALSLVCDAVEYLGEEQYSKAHTSFVMAEYVSKVAAAWNKFLYGEELNDFERSVVGVGVEEEGD